MCKPQEKIGPLHLHYQSVTLDTVTSAEMDLFLNHR